MYDNIGGKIKGLAATVATIASIGAVIMGIITMVPGGRMIVIGLLIMIIGMLIAWISSWLLYGFGQIIDTLDRIEKNTRLGYAQKASSTTASPLAPTVVPKGAFTKKCPHCGEQINSNLCVMCGKSNTLFDE